MAEKFNLRWNDFNSNIVKTFREIRKDEDLFDVTLACADQQQISAHKLILSSSSEYFKNIFKQNKHSHPLLCLLDISSNEMKNILDYIYFGETEIDKDNLERFLRISKRLKIEGLSSFGDPEHIEVDTPFIKQEMDESAFDFDDTATADDSITDTKKNILQPKRKSNKTIRREAIIVNSDTFEDTNDLEEKLSGYIERIAGRCFKCTVCEKVCKVRFAAMEHVQVHFSGLSFPCNKCDTILKTTAAHRQHMKSCHGDNESVLRKDQKQDDEKESKPVLRMDENQDSDKESIPSLRMDQEQESDKESNPLLRMDQEQDEYLG